jgi:hypothetical protein
MLYDYEWLDCSDVRLVAPIMPRALTYAFLYSRETVSTHTLNYKYIWRITPPSADTPQTKTENPDRKLRWFKSLKIATSSINISRQAQYIYTERNVTNDQAVTMSGHVWWCKTWCYLMMRTNHQWRLQWKGSEVLSKGLYKTIKNITMAGPDTLYVDHWISGTNSTGKNFLQGDAHYLYLKWSDLLMPNAAQDNNISCHLINLLN